MSFYSLKLGITSIRTALVFNQYSHPKSHFLSQIQIYSCEQNFNYRPCCNPKVCVEAKAKRCCHHCALSQPILLKNLLFRWTGKGVEMELPFFHPGLPLSENKREKFRGKRGGFPFSGGLEFVTVFQTNFSHTFPTSQVCSKFRLSPDFWLVRIRNNRKQVYNHSKAYNAT